MPSAASSRTSVPHLAGALRVEAVGRLVEHEQLARPQQGGGEAEPLPHAERVVAVALARPRRRARPAPARRRSGAARCAGRRCGRPASSRRRLSRPDRYGWNAGPSTSAPTRGSTSRRRAGHRLAEQRRARPAVGRDQAEQHPDRRRLARPVRPEEAVDGAVRHREVDAVDGDLAAAEPLGQARVASASGHRRRPRPRRGGCAVRPTPSRAVHGGRRGRRVAAACSSDRRVDRADVGRVADEEHRDQRGLQQPAGAEGPGHGGSGLRTALAVASCASAPRSTPCSDGHRGPARCRRRRLAARTARRWPRRRRLVGLVDGARRRPARLPSVTLAPVGGVKRKIEAAGCRTGPR